MRLTLILMLCLLNAGCAIWRSDKEEPVENGPRQAKAEPQLKPSETLKPESREIASPVSDHFYLRGTYFQPSVTTAIRFDLGTVTPGTLLSAEKDLGLDDEVNQARMEFNFRMRDRHQLRIDYFKLDRFHQQPLPRDIVYGGLIYFEGAPFRTRLEWRTLTLTYTYSFFKFERFEAGLGIGAHIIEGHLRGGIPGTPTTQGADAVGAFPTIAANAAFRISRRWAVTLRGQSFSSSPDEFDGTLSDYHGDIQFRAANNLAIGLGYSKLEYDIRVAEGANPSLFNLDTTGPELFFRASF